MKTLLSMLVGFLLTTAAALPAASGFGAAMMLAACFNGPYGTGTELTSCLMAGGPVLGPSTSTTDLVKAPCDSSGYRQDSTKVAKWSFKYCRLKSGVFASIGREKTWTEAGKKVGGIYRRSGHVVKDQFQDDKVKKKSGKFAFLYEDDVVEVLGRSEKKFRRYQGKTQHVYRVRFGKGDAETTWVWGGHLEGFAQPVDCSGPPAWEGRILQCPTSPTVYRVKGANHWAKGSQWVPRFGLLKGTHVRKVARSLSKHWGERYAKVELGCGGYKFHGWSPERLLESSSSTKPACFPMIAMTGIAPAKPGALVEVKGSGPVQLYSMNFRPIGKIKPRVRGTAIMKSLYKWFDGMTTNEQAFMFVASKETSGWIYEKSLREYKPPPPPPPPPPSCPKKPVNPQVAALIFHHWYLEYLAKVDPPMVEAGRLTNPVRAYCRLWEPYFKDYGSETFKLDGREFFSELRKHRDLRCFPDRWLLQATQVYMDVLRSKMHALWNKSPMGFGRYTVGVSSRCDDHVESMVGSWEPAEGAQSMGWADTLYDVIDKGLKCARSGKFSCVLKQLGALLKHGCSGLIDSLGEVVDLVEPAAKKMGFTLGKCAVEMAKGAVCGILDALGQAAGLIAGVGKAIWDHKWKCIGLGLATFGVGTLACGLTIYLGRVVKKVIKAVRCLGVKKTWVLIKEAFFAAGCSTLGSLLRDILLALINPASAAGKGAVWIDKIVMNLRGKRDLLTGKMVLPSGPAWAGKVFNAYSKINPSSLGKIATKAVGHTFLITMSAYKKAGKVILPRVKAFFDKIFTSNKSRGKAFADGIRKMADESVEEGKAVIFRVVERLYQKEGLRGEAVVQAKDILREARERADQMKKYVEQLRRENLVNTLIGTGSNANSSAEIAKCLKQ